MPGPFVTSQGSCNFSMPINYSTCMVLFQQKNKLLQIAFKPWHYNLVLQNLLWGLTDLIDWGGGLQSPCVRRQRGTTAMMSSYFNGSE